jgi:hypothetical protein
MMELAMQLLFTPFVWRMMEQRRSGGGRRSRASARALRAANGLRR